MTAKRTKNFESHLSLQSKPEWLQNFLQRSWNPPTDLFETDTAYIVRVEISGLRETDFTVNLDNDLLTISGTRYDLFARRSAYHQMEIRFGEFNTAVVIPGLINPAETNAEYEDGLLTITLKKK